MLKKISDRIFTDNISHMFFATSIALIFTEFTGVIAVLIDGIVTSRFLGADVFSGISLVKPFSSIIMMIASFFSTGCSVTCSKLVGSGRKKEANDTLFLSAVLTLLFSLIMVGACMLFPENMLRMCGVSLTKYPELNPHMYNYLHGYLIGVPAIMLIQIIGPILVMDNGKRRFTISSVILSVLDIIGDILVVTVFHGGAFGMGLVTSIAYIMQLLYLLLHFFGAHSYFRFGLGRPSLRDLPSVINNGTPALVKKLAGTLRDILTNHFNLIFAMTTAAIAAKGIQGDMFSFLYCIATGMGRAMLTMTGIYHGANDLRSLKRLFTYALKFGVPVTGAIGLLSYLFAPMISGVYTNDPAVLELAVFSIRWMSVALIADMVLSLYMHYLQGIGKQKTVNVLSMGERFFIPVASAWIMGMMYGSKGILASAAVTKFILILCLLLGVCVHCKGLPRKWTDLMFLPDDFGGGEDNNLYLSVRTGEDVVRASEQTQAFCLSHGTSDRNALLMALFTEELSWNVLEHRLKAGGIVPRADIRLYVENGRIFFYLRDLSDHFDPTAYYELNKNNSPEEHIAIRMVTRMATEVRYFNAFNSNNLLVTLE